MTKLLKQKQRSISPVSTTSLCLNHGINKIQNCPFGKCVSINNIVTELDFYQSQINNEEKYDQKNFDDLVVRNISQIINDYHHILNGHLNIDAIDNDSQFKLIHNNTISKHIKCDIHNCIKYKRHIHKAHISYNKIQTEQDKRVWFYIDTMDCIHTHFVHSYDIGVRIRNTNTNTNTNTSTNKMIINFQ